MDELKKQAEELGIKVDGRWSAERLQAEIDEKLAADPEPEVVEPVVAAPVIQEEPVVEAPLVEPEPVVDPEVVADPVEPEPEPEPEVEAAESITITSLIENPMRAFGLAGKGSSATIRLDQLDKALSAKIRRAVELGLIKGE